MITHIGQNTQQQTQPIFLFEEEEQMFTKICEVFSHTPEIKESLKQSRYKVFKKLDPDEIDCSSSDEEEDGLTEEQKMSAYYKHYPTNYGYYQYYTGTNKRRAHHFRKYQTHSYKYYDHYENKDIHHKPQDYSEYYNNKYGLKIRKMDVSDLNKKIKNFGDASNQYWWNRTDINQGNHFDVQFFNSLLNKDDKIKISDDHDSKDNRQKVFISGIINKISKVEKNEEEDDTQDDDTDPVQDPSEINNSVINSFVKLVKKNKLDDLQDLLENSTKYKEAKNMTRQGQKYTDDKFPPNEHSIYGFGDRKDYSLEELKQLPFLRPEVFIKKGPITVFDKITSNDIYQGGLGDCYFLAAISSIAEYPHRLERLFLVKNYNKKGIYVVGMCINGLWQDVVIDDSFPCKKYSKTPAFNTTQSGELWVMILEKAWAKVHGGYMNIAAGLTREALRDLTGASAKTYFTSQNREELWKKLLEADRMKYIITAGSDNLNNGSDSYIEKIGIAGSHAYSLLEAYELEKIGDDYKVLQDGEESIGRNVERLVKLRNPWGKGEWKGDWADNSPKWTPNLKKELRFISQDDGVFYMTYNDFVKYYSDCQICYYHDDYKYSAISVQSDFSSRTGLRFNITKKGLYYLSLNQTNRRFFPKKKKYKYSNCNMVLIKIKDNGDPQFIEGAMKADKENWIAQEIQEGFYMVLVQTPWKSFVNEFSFSIYGPATTNITKFNTKDSFDNDFRLKLFTSHAQVDKTSPMYNFASQGYPQINYKTFDNKGGFGYIYFENNTKDIEMDVVVEMLGSVNINVLPPFSGLRPSETVKPGEISVISYEGTKLPYTAQMRLLSTFKDTKKKENITDQVRKSATVLSKALDGQTLDIKVYVLYHMNGLALLYVNKTEEFTITEELEFDMTNCHIDGAYGSYIEVVVRPNSERLLQIVKDKDASEFEAKIKKLYYKIK